MSLAWRLIKTASRVHPPWRRAVKQFEQFHSGERFYSPIPAIEDVAPYEDALFDRTVRDLPGIELNLEQQLQTLDAIERHYRDLPFLESPVDGGRFHLDNKFFPYSDAVFLYGMLHVARPRRVVEIGSGFSSAAFLDANERRFDGAIDFTFIDPNPQRLDGLLTDRDRQCTTIIREPVQGVALDAFDALRSGDVLFVDSSHVLKVGSDLNHILFEILPRLADGVYIHFHDLYWPFVYSRDAVYRGLSANEAFAVRAFLQFNDRYRIVAWNDLLECHCPDRIRRTLPLCKRNSGSLWLRTCGPA